MLLINLIAIQRNHQSIYHLNWKPFKSIKEMHFWIELCYLPFFIHIIELFALFSSTFCLTSYVVLIQLVKTNRS